MLDLHSPGLKHWSVPLDHYTSCICHYKFDSQCVELTIIIQQKNFSPDELLTDAVLSDTHIVQCVI